MPLCSSPAPAHTKGVCYAQNNKQCKEHMPIPYTYYYVI
nr:MAG TPA: hypothetical protein [Caudoviricetes sp.]